MLIALDSERTPLAVPIIFLAWGVLCWFLGGRKYGRDHRAWMQAVAEQRAKSRLIHPFGGGDVEKEFRRGWRLRWLVPIAMFGYSAGVIYGFVDALR